MSKNKTEIDSPSPSKATVRLETRISPMDSSSTEESVEKSIIDSKKQLSRSGATASYIFTALGNSILHSDEVRAEYYKKKNTLVSKLRSRLKSVVAPIKLPATRNTQLVKAMIAIKFNEEKQIEKAYDGLVKSPVELNKRVNQFWNENKFRKDFDDEQINSVKKSTAEYISDFQIQMIKSKSTQTMKQLLNDAFEEKTSDECTRFIYKECQNLKIKFKDKRDEPTLKTIKKIMDISFVQAAIDSKRAAGEKIDNPELRTINYKIEEEKNKISERAGTTVSTKSLDKAKKLLHNAKTESLASYIEEQLKPERKIYDRIRNELGGLRPKELFENNVASTLANIRLDHKINRQFAKDSLLFKRPEEKNHAYNLTRHSPGAGDHTHVKMDTLMYPSGKVNQILQFPSQTSDKEGGEKEGREYEAVGKYLASYKPSEVTNRLKNVLQGKEGGKDDSSYYNTLGNLMFAVETARNPGAVLSNVIYLDELGRKNSKLKPENINSDLPMGFKGAVDGSRALHEELRPYLKDRTYYDYGSGGREQDKNLIKARDTRLLVNWLKHNDIALAPELTEYRKLLNKTALEISTLDSRSDAEREIAKKGEKALSTLFADEKIYPIVKGKLQQLVKNWYQLDIEPDLPAIGRKGDKIEVKKPALEVKDQFTGKLQTDEDKSKTKVIDPIKSNVPVQDIENAFNQKDNQKYWLQDKDINQILKFKKNNNDFPRDKVKDCIILPVFNGTEAQNLAISSARNGVKAQIQNLRTDENFVGLANHGNHWTAFKVMKDINNKLSCQFMNSSTDSTYFDQFQQTLKNLNVGIDKSKISIVQCNQQTDGSACGFFALENAQKLASKSDIKVQDTFSQTSVADTRKLYGKIYAEQAVSDVSKTLVNNLEIQRVIDFSAEEKKIKTAISDLANDSSVFVGRVAQEDRFSKGNYQYTITVNNDPSTINKISDFLKNNTVADIAPDKEGIVCKFYIPRKFVTNPELKTLIEAKDKEIEALTKNYTLKSIKVQVVENHEIVGPYDNKLYDKSGNKELNLSDLFKTDSATLKLKKEYIQNHLVLMDDKKLSTEALQIASNISLKLEDFVLKIGQQGKTKDVNLSKLQEPVINPGTGADTKRSREVDKGKLDDSQPANKKQKLEKVSVERDLDNKNITFRRKKRKRRSKTPSPITKKTKTVISQLKTDDLQTSPSLAVKFSAEELKTIKAVGNILSSNSTSPSPTKPSPKRQSYISRSSSPQNL